MGKNIISKIFLADFETATINTEYFKTHNDTRVLLGHIKEMDGDLEYTFTTIEEFFKWLTKDYGYSAMVYFHNLKFDGDFILKYLTQHYKMYNKIPPKTYGFSCLRQVSNIYEIQFQFFGTKGNKNWRKIIFRCSFKILSSGIEALGKSVGISKFEGDEDENFYNVEPMDNVDDYDKKFVEYCKRDVEIAKRSLREFDNAMNFLKNKYDFLKSFIWNGKMTAASISLKLQKGFIKDKWGYVIARGLKHSIEENEIADNFYFGGFTQFNADYQNIEVKCKNGMSIDINSAHPFSMTKPLPYGNLYNWENQQPLNDKYLEFYEIEVEKAETIYGGIACLYNWKKSYNSKNINERFRYVFYLENFTCYYLKEEWEIMQKFYKFTNARIVKRYWMHSENYLKDFIDIMYKYKSDFKEQGKDGLSQTFKIILNAGYGIHAKRWDYNSYFVCEDRELFERLNAGVVFEYNKKKWEVVDYKGEIHCLDNQYIKVVKQLGIKKANNKFIASTITAYSRIYLLETILKLGVDNVLYCDTDSIYMKDCPENLNELIDIDKYRLGAWDIEKRYDKFFTKGAKVYYASKNESIIKATYSGINRKWLKDNLDYNVFHNSELLHNANLKLERCKSGTILIPKDYVPKDRTI